MKFYHKWLLGKTERNPGKLAWLIKKEAVMFKNPLAFELLRMTGDKEYTDKTFKEAAKYLLNLK